MIGGAPAEPPREIAVVDIGSNSVRLVLYRVEGRAVWTVFNEKVLAGLGRGVRETGRLSPEGVELALTALRRFSAVLEGVRPEAALVAATAAVREAEDGQAFCDRVAAETALRVRVLSGQEEARYAALGTVAGAPSAQGVVADMGGASLELVRVGAAGAGADRIGEGVTLPLGPFSLIDPGGFDIDRIRALVHERIKPVAKAYRTPTLHAVGGAWRSLAQVHMALTSYPLKVVHQYAMTASDALDVARLVARQSRASLDKLPGVSRKRAETLPYAALVLEGLIDRLELQGVSFSAWGLREGLLFEHLGESEEDPLIAGCAALGARQGVSPFLPAALDAWLRPVTAHLPEVFGPERDAVLTTAACQLADLGARLHPDHRVELVFDQVLRCPVPGQTHVERAFLATALNARYGGSETTPEPELVNRLLDDQARRRARALGQAMRLACDLSGRSSQLLANAVVALDDVTLRLSATQDYVDMLLGEQTRRRAKALAETLDVKLAIDAA
ncbi:Ppx/GppA phosphatase family protein [Brevundimonas balnearis]|uniref:Ppx/GppA family phosphatase n=1 Tax=Brevundimonas balnearis TaxID=1572858 RepID=A0ABV6QYK9_9CAUL